MTKVEQRRCAECFAGFTPHVEGQRLCDACCRVVLDAALHDIALSHIASEHRRCPHCSQWFRPRDGQLYCYDCLIREAEHSLRESELQSGQRRAHAIWTAYCVGMLAGFGYLLFSYFIR